MDNLNSELNSQLDLRSGFEAIYESLRVMNELRDTTQEILDLAIHLTGAENCSLMMLNGHGELYVLNAKGLREANLRFSRIKIGEGIAGRVAAEGSPLLVEDIASDERFAPYGINKYRTGSFIACPITSKENIIGVLNLNDKISGQPFNPEDFDNAKFIAMIASVALRSFLSASPLRIHGADIEDLYQRLVEAECNDRGFLARICHDIRTPLTNIKGVVYYLRNSTDAEGTKNLEFYEIIEKEVNYLISYIDQGTRDYERMKNQLLDMEERQKYKHLLK